MVDISVGRILADPCNVERAPSSRARANSGSDEMNIDGRDSLPALQRGAVDGEFVRKLDSVETRSERTDSRTSGFAPADPAHGAMNR